MKKSKQDIGQYIRLGSYNSFDEFLRNLYDIYKKGDIKDCTHVRQQWHFIIDDNDNFNKNIEIIKYESMKKDFNDLAKRDNRYNIFNKIYDKMYYKPKDLIFTELQLNMINDIYIKDFEMFGYDIL